MPLRSSWTQSELEIREGQPDTGDSSKRNMLAPSVRTKQADQQVSPLVIAKTRVPPRRSELLRRPRLVDALYAQIEKQLFLISAPAGYGKTSLLIDFANDADFPVAWYALDEFDNTPHTFLEYLIASIRLHFSDFGASALAALQRSSGSFDSLHSVVALMANDFFRLPDHLVIVLDDYHVIHNEVIDQLLALLIKYAGENCHIFLDSRTLPRIPDQILLLARGQMDGISVNELRFTPPEIQALVQQNYALTVSEGRAQELAQITDGWITALLLMGHQAGWGTLVEGVLTAPDAAGRVYDYLAEQVFSHQPEETRQFLLGSSVLDPLSPDLLDSLPELRNSRKHLECLQEQQLFVTRLGGNADLYAYHPLFREFLKSRLMREHPAWYEQLSLASAELYAKQGQWEHVVELYLSLGRGEDAARALESAEASLRVPSRIAVMSKWVEALPQSVSQFRPHLLSLKGKIHRSRGELEQAVACFDRAAKMFEEGGDIASAAEKLELKGTILRILGRYRESIEQSDKIDSLVSNLPPPETVRLRGMSLHLRGSAEYSLGELSHAFTHLNEARGLFSSTDDLLSQAVVNHDLGITARAGGRLRDALEYYSEAIRLWERLGTPNDAANTLNSLGYIYYLQGETQEAEKILRDALDRAREAGIIRIEALVLATLGDLYRDNGNYPQALEFYGDSLRTAQKAHAADFTLYSKIATGDCYRLMGDFGRAREWLDSAQESGKTDESLINLGQLKLSHGLLANDQGKLDAAVKLLTEAVGRFQQAGNKHLETLAEFNLAHALNLLGRAQESEPHLIRTAKLVDALGYDHFLVVEGRRTEMTLRMASTLNDVGPLFKHILERMRPLPSDQLKRTPVAQATPALTVHTMGQERFMANGVEVTQLRPQVRELFFFLLSRYPLAVRRDELWDLFWPDLSEERADGALRITIMRIRKALSPVNFLNGSYTLAAEHLWYDVHEFERGLADASRAQNAQARISRLQQALEVYGGDYLMRIGSNWVMIERERLRKAYLGALISLAEAYTQVGDLHSALHTFEKTTGAEPFLEAAWQGGMQTYLRMGNRAAALAHYEKLKSILHKEMGIEPSPEVQALHQRIVNMRA